MFKQLLLLTGFGVVLAATPGLAQDRVAGTPTPEAAIEKLHDGLVEAAATLGDEPINVRYDALLPVVGTTHDLPYIAQLTIRREWAGLSEAERERFVDAFVRLSVMTYAGRFSGLDEGMFEIGESKALAGHRVSVSAELTTRAGDVIPFEYVLHETDDGWKIVNILADNVSDLALKRAEYRRLLDGGSIQDVIAELKRQAAEIAE